MMVGDLTYTASRPKRRSRARLVLGMLLSLAALLLAAQNRAWIVDAIELARSARPMWLLAALGIILGSYLLSSQVFRVVLRSLGHRAGVLRLWATALVAIVTSQSMPAGGVGSYAFLLRSFRRQGATTGEAALIAALEAFSYAGAMVLFSAVGLAYLASHVLLHDTGIAALAGPLLAGLAALLVIGGLAAVMTRPPATLTRGLLGANRLAARALRRPWGEEWVHHLVGEIVGARELLAGRKRLLALLVLIQLTALSGHSLALLAILYGLGAPVGLGVVGAAFGIALITSTFNVLPGGGGTVEAVLVLTLAQLGAGAAAVPAAILFRLLNFWVMLPLAGICYSLMSRDKRG
jgi:uncharacterized membrane protein YbhN (UPF0104 family)